MTYDGPNTMAVAMLSQLEDMISQYREIDGQLQAAKGDRESALKHYIKTSDNERVVELRNLVERAQKELFGIADENVLSVELSEAEQSRLKTEADNLKNRVRAGFSMAKKLPAMGGDEEGINAYLETLTDPTKGTSSGPRKPSGPRASVWVKMSNEHGLVKPAKSATDPDTCPFDNPEHYFKSLSFAANVLGTDLTGEMTQALAGAAGVPLDEVSSIDHPVEFTYQAPNGKVVQTIQTWPKERKTPGRKPAAQ